MGEIHGIFYSSCSLSEDYPVSVFWGQRLPGDRKFWYQFVISQNHDWSRSSFRSV